ncbi:tyrosine-type recombinase/integrase [Nocardia cyriacigeorgica]|uniref:Tyrosine-type recombinase/integrase n=1 Tax=Nocardia cyriacigeorgica TaxID=135487 RepID=A0ABX0CE96_9NOCA|nr:tyrosine-type recombinase/integrase [Nocardia cyriacigeorgica]NEW42772.1 tyrosine-type recombinase/integrase [Nocardia cyriacigeorgica]NEW53933.1 tyrosine-type recombinase/integrase [Nocardia cyriacigeorgica]NEW54478.1 tyrosine-type recombinase/integrase [Nocardia cyriacigeorgica]
MPPKKRRRPRGEGAFYKRKSDNLWIGAITYEDEYGKTQRATVSSSDKVIAMEKFRKLRGEVETGTYRPRAKMTAARWLDYWVQEMVKPNKAPGTYRSYRGIIDNQIVPDIGEKKRMPLAPADIRANLKWVGENWSARTAELTYAVWSKALADAKGEGVIATNPIEQVAKPINNTKTGKALSSADARKVLLTSIERKDPMATRWATALILGARQGECLGLERDRINLDDLTIDLSWQLQSLPTKEGYKLDHPDRFDVPKGYECRPVYRRFALTRRKGQRPTMIPLPNPLAAIYEVYLDSTPPNQFGLVWVSKAGTPIPNKYDSDAWHDLLESAGVGDIRLHDARHTTATLLLEMGVEESVRMQIMGQSTVAAQRRYAHVDRTLARKALGNLDGLLAIPEK